MLLVITLLNSFQVFFFDFGTLLYIDGKQARRTNTSSPLGELFDHGCDSISTIVVRYINFSCIKSNFNNEMFSNLLLPLAGKVSPLAALLA